MKLSIVVPVYNSAAYLPELLCSLDAQTLQDYRVVFVDDGSADCSARLIGEWIGRRDAGDRLICTENRGQSAARNSGFEAVVADAPVSPWTLFLDSDDKLVPSAVEELLAHAERLDVDDLLYAASVEYETTELEERYPSYKTLYERDFLDELHVVNGRSMLARLVEHDKFVAQPCLQLLKTSFLLEADVRFEEGIIHEDNLFSAQCLLRAERVAYLNRHLYVRRVRAGSTMTRPLTWRNVDGYFRCAELLLHEPAVTDEAVSSAIVTLAVAWFGQAAAVYRSLPESERHGACSYGADRRVLFASTVCERARLLDRIEELGRMLEREREAALALGAELQAVRESETYRVGRALMAVPRWIKRTLGR